MPPPPPQPAHPTGCFLFCDGPPEPADGTGNRVGAGFSFAFGAIAIIGAITLATKSVATETVVQAERPGAVYVR